MVYCIIKKKLLKAVIFNILMLKVILIKDFKKLECKSLSPNFPLLPY